MWWEPGAPNVPQSLRRAVEVRSVGERAAYVEPDPLARRLAAAPLDDEPLTDEDRETLREAQQDFAAGRVVLLEELRRELGV
jgi:hypothetical protein